ncbi:MAG: mechanosensitive ion channel family protein [Anaerolineales bacterium]
MNQVFWDLSRSEWLEIGISGLILFSVLLLGRWVISLILDKILFRISKRTKNNLDNHLLNAARLPLYLMAVVLALDTALRRLSFLPEDWNILLREGFFVLYFLVGFVFAWRLITHIFTWLGEEISQKTEASLDKQLIPFFQRIVLMLLSSIGIITILSHFEINITAMVTTLGIGSLAIALAAQSALEDSISGFLIMVDRPFRIGDRIELMDLDTWGDVVDIGLRSTRIRTRDNRMVVVPNSVIGKSLVVNYAYPNDQYRLQIHIGVAYGTDLEKARQVMVDAVKGVEGVLPDRKVEALFLEFGESTLIFRVRWWLESYVDTRRMFDRVNTALYNALQKENIQLPFPQLDVHIQNKDRTS